jgi:flagellar capping protein FliD
MENIKKFVEDINTAENAKARAMENIADELTGLIRKLADMGVTVYAGDYEFVVTGVSYEDGKLSVDSAWVE